MTVPIGERGHHRRSQKRSGSGVVATDALIVFTGLGEGAVGVVDAFGAADAVAVEADMTGGAIGVDLATRQIGVFAEADGADFIVGTVLVEVAVAVG